LVELVVAILGRVSKTTTNTVVNVDSSVAILLERLASGSFLIVDRLDVWKTIEVSLGSVISVNLGVVHHLRTAGADSNDLAKVSSLFNKAVKFLADALDLVVVCEITVLGEIPSVNVDGVLG